MAQNLLAHNHDIDAFGQKENWLSLQYESVNLEKAQPEIKRILQETSERLRAVFNSEEYKGSDVVWATLASDTLTKKGLRKEVLQ